MFDMESKINALAEDFGLESLIEILDLTPYCVVKALVESGVIDTDEVIRMTEELDWWKELEE